MSRRVSLSPEKTINSKHGGASINKANGYNKRTVFLRILSFKHRFTKDTRFSPACFFRNVGTKVARALQFVSSRSECLRSRKVSSAASLARSRSCAETLDSQRAEAIEDCIEFLNSSSASLPRSNSVTSSCN